MKRERERKREESKGRVDVFSVARDIILAKILSERSVRCQRNQVS